MKRAILVFGAFVMVGCGSPQQSAAPRPAPKDPKLVAMEERIAKTTDEGKQMIEKVKAMKPEVNEQVSGKTLGEKVQAFATENGAFNIIPIGWEASQKKNGRWKIIFDYQDYQKNYLVAEWEFNPETKKLYPFEFDNAKTFWEAPATPAKGKK